MRKFYFFLLSVISYHTAISQAVGTNAIAHTRLSFEIGQSYLNIDNLNQEIQNLDLLPLSPDIGNFAFQLGLGYNERVEGYFTITLLFSSIYDDTMSHRGMAHSSSLNGTYIGAGVRINLLTALNNRLIVSIPLEINKAFYTVELTEAYPQNVPAHVLVDNSRILLARYENMVAQPAIEVLYRLLNRKDSFDVGFKVGYLYHVFQNDWTNRRGAVVRELSPIRNNGNLNVSLKLAYTFN